MVSRSSVLYYLEVSDLSSVSESPEIELILFLNSLIEAPIALPISGSFDGPKITKAITNIKINSLVPILDNMTFLLQYYRYRGLVHLS